MPAYSPECLLLARVDLRAKKMTRSQNRTAAAIQSRIEEICSWFFRTRYPPRYRSISSRTFDNPEATLQTYSIKCESGLRSNVNPSAPAKAEKKRRTENERK